MELIPKLKNSETSGGEGGEVCWEEYNIDSDEDSDIVKLLKKMFVIIIVIYVCLYLFCVFLV